MLLAGCGNPGGMPSSATPTSASQAPPLATTVILGDGRPSALPAVQARRERITAALMTPPFLLLREDLDARLTAAQTAAVNDAQVQAATSTGSGERLRAEVMVVAAARAGDLPPAISARCSPGACTRVVIYVYPTNTTLTVIVAADGTVIDQQILAEAQPEIPADLADLATQIAINDPQVAAAFNGLTPAEAMAAMSATKTALEDTSCERSRHLCVAPVFTWGEQALWTIVDLTDFALTAATTWTDQGQSARRAFSEATLQDAAIAPLCETPQTIDRDGWQASYMLTSSDGLELRDLRFQGRLLLRSVKVVDWHVGYEGTDGQRVGFSDAVGCPVFSAAAVIPYSPPEVRAGPGEGFTLAITFRSPAWPQPCNYQYTFAARFNPDGSLGLIMGNEGRGCGINGLYHPIMRLEPGAATSVTLWNGSAAQPLTSEGLAEWPANGPQAFGLEDAAGQLTVAPVWGDAQFAYVYWTALRPEEGQGDLPSIGSCCALDAGQGPDQFINPGGTTSLSEDPVLWFVPRIQNAERERCWADMTLVDGMLQPEIWPCEAGVTIRAGGPDGTP